MKQFKRVMAMLLCLVMTLGLFAGLTLPASAANITSGFMTAPAGTYSKVTDFSTLNATDTYIIVFGTSAAMSTTQNSNNRSSVSVTVSSNTVTLTASNTVQAIKLVSSGDSSYPWKLNTVSSGVGYLYAPSYASGTSNYLRTSDTASQAGSDWSISASDIHSTGDGTRRYMKLNGSLVSCYQSSSTYPTADLYKLNTSVASHTLSSSVSPSGAGSVALGATSVAEGGTATATATANTGYVFSSWSISGTGASLSSTSANPTTVTMGTADATVTATFTAKTTASITLSRNGTTETPSGTYYVGDSYTLPGAGSDVNGHKHVGWSSVTITTPGSKPTTNYYELGAEVSSLGASQTFYAVYAILEGSGNATTKTDELTVTSLNVTATAYTSGTFSNKSVTSDAKYAGQVIKGGNPAYIQFRGTSPGGIVTTTSGGTAKSITVTWGGSNTNGRILNIYGSNTAYTDGSSIYSETPVGTITFATGDTTGSYTFTDDYEYIGIRPASGAAYCNEIDVVWQTGTPATYSGYTTAPQAQVNPTYTVSVTSGITGGSVSASPATAEEGDTITVTATPNTGYELTALTYTPAGGSATNINGTTFTMPAANVTVNATFSQIDYTITKSATNGTITAAATANYNDSVSFTVAPSSGYQIDSVTVKDASNNNVTVSGSNGSYSFTMPASDVTITAICSALPTYSYTIYNNGTSVGSGTAASVTAPAAPSPNTIQYTDPSTLATSTFTFAGWGVQSTAITEPGAYTGTLYAAGETIPLSANDTVIRAIYVNGSGGNGFKLSYTYQGTEYFAGAKGSGDYLSASTDATEAVGFGMEQYNNSEYYYLFYTVNGDKYYLTGTSSSTLTISNANTVPNSGFFLWKETESSGTYTFTSYNTSGTSARPLAFNNSTKDRYACYNSANTLTKTSGAAYLTEAGATYYAVTYYENAGSDTVTNMPSNTSVRDGNSYSIPNMVPVRDGYRFDGWATSASGSTVYAAGSLPTSITVTAAVNLYAHWTSVPQATVTFYAADNTTTFDTQTVYEGVAPTAPSSDPTKDPSGIHYYTFSGWSRTAGGSVESPLAVIASGESTRAYYPIFTEDTAAFTLSFSGRTKVSTEGSFVSTVLTPSLTTTQEGCSATVTGLTINSGSNDSIATVSTTGNVLTVTGVSAGSLTLNVTASFTGGTATGTVTVTVISGSGGAAGGYTLVTRDTVSDADIANYDWSGEYIITARELGTSEKINTWKVMSFNWTDATTATIGDGSGGNNITGFELDPADCDDFGVATATTSGVTLSALHTGELDYETGATTTGSGLVFDRIVGFTDSSDNDITDQYVLVFEQVDEINNYYTIRIKGTNFYLTNSNTSTSGGNAMGGTATPESIGAQLMWKISWASSSAVHAITASASGDTTATPDMLLIESVEALKNNVSRALFYNQAGNGFRVYGNGAYTGNLNRNSSSGYNVFLYGKQVPFESEIIYNDTPRNTTTAKIEVPYNYITATGKSTLTLQSDLVPETYPGWTVLNNGLPTSWNIVGGYTANNAAFNYTTTLTAVSGTKNATFTCAHWDASYIGYYYVVRVNYQAQDPDGVIHDVPQQAMIVVTDADLSFQTVINEASSLDHTGSWTVPSRVGSSGVDLNAYIIDNFSEIYSQRSIPAGFEMTPPSSWTYASQQGYTYTISSEGVVTWTPSSILKNDVVVITATAALTQNGTPQTVAAGTFTLYVNKLAYTAEVQDANDSTNSTIPFGSTAFAVTLGDFQNNDGAAPNGSNYTINSATEWTWTAATLAGASVPITRTSTGATINVTDLAAGTEIIVRATNVIATSLTTSGVHTVVTVHGKTFTVGEDGSLRAVNDTFVLDFDCNAVLDVMSNDSNAGGATISAIGGTNASMAAIGTGANAGKITFTVPGGALTSTYTFTYTLSKSGEEDSTATVTVRPATAIYYEESNSFFTYADGTQGKWSDEGTADALTQDADASEIGFDANLASLTYSGGTIKKARVGGSTDYGTSGSSGTWPTMEFSFVGNAMELYMLRNYNSGVVRVTVDGTKKIIPTYYGASSASNEGGWIYNQGGNYYGMPVYAWGDPNSTDTAASHTVLVEVMYSRYYDTASAGYYDVFIDGVRIYNPNVGGTTYKYISFRDTVIAAGTLGVPTTAAHSYAATVDPMTVSVGTVAPHNTQQLTVGLTDGGETVSASGYSVGYDSADSTIATVSDTGLVTGVAEGTTTVTVTVTPNGGAPITKTVTVNVSSTVYTVTYKLPNGDQEVTYATSTISLGDGVTHLTSAQLAEYNAHNYSFRGWLPASAAPLADTDTMPGIMRDNGASVTLTGDATYYAVYTYGTTDNDFLLKTDLTTPLVTGDTILIYETEGAANADKYVLSCEDYGDSDWRLYYRSGAEAVPANNIITKTNTSLYWDVVATTGGFYLKDQSGKYLSATSTDGQLVMVTTPDEKAVWNATTTGVSGANSVYIYNSEASPKYIQHYSGYPEFCAYTYDSAWANKNEMQIYVRQGNNTYYTTNLLSNTVRYNVNYYVNGTAYSSEQIAEGSNPSFPALADTYNELAGYSHDYTFLGWIPAAIAEDTTTAPTTIYTSGDTYAVNAATSFYAVFTYTGAGSAAAGYSLTTVAPADGDNIIIARLVDGTYYAMTTAETPSSSALTIANGVVDSPASSVIWDVSDATSGVYLKPNGGSNYLHMNSSALKVASGETNGDIVFTLNSDGQTFKGTRADDARWIVTSDANGFGCSATEANAANLYIFKYSTTGGSQAYYATTLGAAAPITHDYAASISPSTLALHAGETGTVSATLTDNGSTVSGATPTYTTSLAAVATVAADGTVTAVGNGTATITATYTVDGNDYTATCAVTVTTLATYTVTYMVNGSQYGSTESVTQGSSPSFTAPVYDVSSYTAHAYEFLGWKEDSALSGDTTEAQTLYVAGNTHVISANTTYYAVYRYTEGGSVLTQAIDLSNGASADYVIAANVGGTYYAMHNSSFSGKLDRTQIATPGSSISASDATGYVVTIAKSADGWTISNGTNMLGYPSSGTDFTNDTHPYWNIDTGSHGSYRVTNTNTTTRGITYRSGSTNKFAPYATSNINGTEYYDVEIIPVGGSGSGTTYYATTLNTAASHTYVASISPTSVTVEAGQETTAIGTLTDNGIATTDYTPTYTSSNTGVATVSSIGYVDAISAGSATITVTYTVDGTDYSATCAVTVTAATVVTSYTVSYYVNGSLFETETVAENGHPDFDAPTVNVSGYDAHSYSFIGWAASTVSETTTAPTMYTSANASNYTVTGNVTFHAVYTWGDGGSGGSGTVTDTLTASDLAATSTAYMDFSNVKKNTAIYAGQSAKDNSGNIQMRSKNSNSGIVTTTSGGTVSSVTINVGSGSNTVDVYGSNTAYSSAADLYDSATQGTKIGSVSATGTVSFPTSGTTYTYVGIRSNNGAIYLSSVEVVWSTGSGSGSGSTNYYTTTLEAGTGETATLSVSPTSMSLSTGGYAQLSVTAANGGAGAYVTATSSNTSVAVVTALNDGANSFGVSAGSTGSATVTVRYFDSSDTQLASQTVSVTVTAATGTGGTNSDYGRVGSDGNAPTTSGSVNAGTRGVVATSISQKAADYYSTKGVTWADLAALSGATYANGITSVEAATNNALKSRLQTLMTLTNTVTYSSLTTYWPSTDKSGGSNQNLYIYSNVTSNSSVSREHVWPKSRGQFYESGAGSDLQHLRPEESTVNSTRGNHTMGYVNGVISGCSTKTYGGNTVLWYSGSYSSNNCSGLVEVMDCCKGDVARILLYVYTEYPENTNLFTKTSGGGSGNNASDGNKVIESLDTLLRWCAEDPVDTWEMSRNDAVQNIQGNRNVYIDYPELAWMIFGLTPPTTMQTPSGQAAAGNVGTRNAANYPSGGRTLGREYAVMDTEPVVETRGVSIVNTGAALTRETTETREAETVATRGNYSTSTIVYFDLSAVSGSMLAADAEIYVYAWGSGVTAQFFKTDKMANSICRLILPAGNWTGFKLVRVDPAYTGTVEWNGDAINGAWNYSTDLSFDADSAKNYGTVSGASDCYNLNVSWSTYTEPDTSSDLPTSGAVLIDGRTEAISNNDAVLAYLEKYGAKNCLIVPANGAVVFYLSGGGDGTEVAIGASALNGTATVMKVYQIDSVDGDTVTGTVRLNQVLATSTEMYYGVGGITWTGDKSNVLMVRNEGTAPMLITNLRASSSSAEGQISTRSAQMHNSLDALEMTIDPDAITAGLAAVHALNEGTFGSETPIIPIAAPAAVLTNVSLSLEGLIGVNFYVNVPDEMLSEGYYFTVGGERAELVNVEGTQYRITGRVAAKEMNDAVELKLFNRSGEQQSFGITTEAHKADAYRYSVAAYIAYIEAHADDFSGELLTLVRAMKAYGSYAQTYFEYGTANAVDAATAAAIDAVTIDAGAYEEARTADTANIRFYGESVVTESETAIRFYFTLSGDVNDYTVTVNGENGSFVKAGERYYVAVSNIAAKDLGKGNTVTVTYGEESLTISNYSVYTYVRKTLETAADADLIKAVKALKYYGDCAAAYFGD